HAEGELITQGGDGAVQQVFRGAVVPGAEGLLAADSGVDLPHPRRLAGAEVDDAHALVGVDDVVGLDVLVQHVPAVEGAKAGDGLDDDVLRVHHRQAGALPQQFAEGGAGHVFRQVVEECLGAGRDRKSTRLNSSHVKISYAVY